MSKARVFVQVLKYRRHSCLFAFHFLQCDFQKALLWLYKISMIKLELFCFLSFSCKTIAHSRMTAFFLLCIWDVPEQKASFPGEQKRKKTLRQKENTLANHLIRAACQIRGCYWLKMPTDFPGWIPLCVLLLKCSTMPAKKSCLVLKKQASLSVVLMLP